MAKKNGDKGQEKKNLENPEMEQPQEAQAPETEEETKADAEIDALRDQLMRTMAEFDNYRKRTIKEKEALHESAVCKTVEAFLPVMDNLSRALSVSEDSDMKTVLDGVKMIQKQLSEVFEKLQVKPIEAVGKPFDPELHNAIMHVEDEEAGENIVVEEFVKGYTQNGRVIRHSVVKVAN